MRTTAMMSGTILLVIGVGLTGCHRHRGTVVVERGAAFEEPGQQVIVVREAPPPIIVERRPPPPAAGYVWVDGYWHWDGQRYGWRGGQWALPPRGRELWVAPRYDRRERGYEYHPGHWEGRGGPAPEAREGHRERR